MIDFEYLYKGVCGLANAHRAGTMAGHLGAAVAAGYFFGEDHSELPDPVFEGIRGELQRVIAGEEAIWFNTKKAGMSPADLFQPFPKEPSNPAAIASVAAALQKNVGETRQSGHNVIFASIAIRALRDHPEFATPAIVTGIRKLVEGFQGAHAGRGYYGLQTGWRTGNQVTLDPGLEFPAYESISNMVQVTVAELIQTAAVRRQGFGGLWHVINHAAAIVELQRCGFEDVAQQALGAHHQHIRLWRSLPDVQAELGPVIKSEHHPQEAQYWAGRLKRDEARLTHRIKTMYGFSILLTYVEDAEQRQAAQDAFLYLMA